MSRPTQLAKPWPHRGAMAVMLLSACGGSAPAPSPSASPARTASATATPSRGDSPSPPVYSQQYCLDGALVESVPGLQTEPLKMVHVAPEGGKVALFTNEPASAKTLAVTLGACTVAEAVRNCRNMAAIKGSTEGFLELTVVVDDTGKLVNAKRTAGSLTDDALKKCMEEAIAGARFDKEARGETALLIVPQTAEAVIILLETGTTVEGRLAPARVKTVVRERFPSLRQCFESTAKLRPFIELLVTMRFVIDEAGKPTQLDVATDDATFRACITKVVSGMTFPQPESGKVIVAYPIRFRSDR